MKSEIPQDLYRRSLALNEEAFKHGLFDAAYHALASAMHCAEFFDTDPPFLEIIQIATRQLAWIDEYHPEYEHSTQSAKRRSQSMSIFRVLANQAQIRMKMRYPRRRANEE